MPPAIQRRRTLFAAGFLALAAILGLLGYLSYSGHITHAEDRHRGLFKDLLPLQSAALDRWQEERTADLLYYVSGKQASALFSELGGRHPGPKLARRLSDWYTEAAKAHPEYIAMSVSDARGRLLWSSSPHLAGISDWGAPAPIGELTVVDGRALVACRLQEGSVVVTLLTDVTNGVLPSLGGLVPLTPGGFDIYLARPDRDGALVLDHDPQRPGRTKIHTLPAQSAVARALKSGGMTSGRDHFGREILAASARKDWVGWRPVGAREVGGAASDSRMLALVFAGLGALSVLGAYLLISRLLAGAEESGGAATRRLDTLLIQAPDAILLFDREGRILDANLAAVTNYGYPREELLGLHMDDLRPPEERPRTAEARRAVLAEGTGRFSFLHRRKDGSVFPVEVLAKRLDSNAGPALQAFVRDLTETVRAQKRIHLLSRLHEARRACSAVAVAASTPQGLLDSVCRILVEVGGFQLGVVWRPDAKGESLVAASINGLPAGGAPPPPIILKEGAGTSIALEAHLGGKTVVADDISRDPRTVRFREFCKTNDCRSALALPVRYQGGSAVLLVTSSENEYFKGEVLDVIASIDGEIASACKAFRAAEASLRVGAELAHHKRLLEHVTTALPLGVYIFDVARSRNVFATRAVAAIVGKSLEQIHILGPALFTENLHPDDMGVFAGYAERFKKTADGEVVESVYRFRAGEGWKWLKSRDVVFERSETGEPTLILGTLEDVTASVKSREALEKSWSDYRRVLQAVECAAESIVISDENGIIQYVNPACARITGYSREEVVGRHTRGLKSGVHPPEFYKDLWQTITSGRVWTGHLVNKRKDGTFFEEDASIAPVKDEHGRVTNYVAVKKDVSKERSLEVQLQQSQKLDAVGRLAGGVAHDFNNILTAILGYAHLGHEALPPDSPVRDDLAEIKKGARRAADLTRQLLIFSRKQVIEPRLLDPALVVGGIQKMLRRIVGEDVALRFISEPKGRLILADPGQLEQVVLNFVVNGRDAMPGGGDLEVAVRDIRLDETINAVDGPIPPGAYSVVSVRDSGAGIPPSVLPRIFEPFFTTKPVGEGTGLGLSTVYGIVKQGGAYLAVDTQVGKGTLMSVYWPSAAESQTPAEAAAPEPASGGSERLLLVEDEPAVLQLTQRLLSRAGYSVRAFPEAASALAWARSPDAAFEGLVTDVVLPGGMGGKGLVDALLALRPGLRALYTSGYTDEAISHQGVLDPGTRLLPKPFSEDALLRAVRDALDGA